MYCITFILFFYIQKYHADEISKTEALQYTSTFTNRVAICYDVTLMIRVLKV